MSAFGRRLARLERQIGGAGGGDVPSEDEFREALALSDRYHRVWGSPNMVAQALDMEPPVKLMDLSPEDQAFVAKYEGGMKARVEDVIARYDRAHPERGETTRRIVDEIFAEADRIFTEELEA
jgi:hypothetical protein